jgi:hypothetical protein
VPRLRVEIETNAGFIPAIRPHTPSYHLSRNKTSPLHPLILRRHHHCRNSNARLLQTQRLISASSAHRGDCQERKVISSSHLRKPGRTPYPRPRLRVRPSVRGSKSVCRSWI